MKTIVKKSFTSPDETKKPFAKGTIETVTIGELVVHREIQNRRVQAVSASSSSMRSRTSIWSTWGLLLLSIR